MTKFSMFPPSTFLIDLCTVALRVFHLESFIPDHSKYAVDQFVSNRIDHAHLILSFAYLSFIITLQILIESDGRHGA